MREGTIKQHTFRFRITDVDGTHREVIAKAKVRKAKKAVKLELTADMVRCSIKAGGIGNTQTCSMAVSTKAQANQFPHPVIGFVDWFYRSAYVASKLGKDGLPCECYVYEHRDDVARLNDSKGGQQKLLKELEKDGPWTILLSPPKPKKKEFGRHPGKPTGERSRRNGGQLRFAVAYLGGAYKVPDSTQQP